MKLTHKSGYSISFNTFGALEQIDHKAELPKVIHANDWLSRYGTVIMNNTNLYVLSKTGTTTDPAISPELHTVYEYDWTYTTHYKGTIENEKVSKISNAYT